MVPELIVHNNRRLKPPKVSIMIGTKGHVIISNDFSLMFWIFSLIRRMSIFGTPSAKVGGS